MRIHTNLTNLTPVRIASGAPIHFETHAEHGSRTHARSFEVRLGGSGGRNNTGQYGAGNYDGATWDEWGAFFGALFAADPTARVGGTAKRPVYANAGHFNFETGDRFKARNVSTSIEPSSPDYLRTTHMPTDTHPRHRWEPEAGLSHHDQHGRYVCTHKAGCSATRPTYRASEAYRRDNLIGA